MADLFSPLQIGRLELKNRIMMAPMENGMANIGGMVSERLINFFVERARNNVAVIMTGSVAVAPEGAGLPAQIAIYDEKFIPGLTRLCDAVHEAGAKIGAQIYHGGGQATEAVTGLVPVAASAFPCSLLNNHPRALTREELPDMAQKFSVAAERAIQAGFDLIEVHFAHGYLLAGFLSPHSNHRDDEYGGSFENRCRFPFEVLDAVIRTVNGRVPVSIRISVQEFLDDGLCFEDVKNICLQAERYGVQAVSITAGCYDSIHTSIQPMFIPRAFLIPYAEKLKNLLSVPVIVAGRLNDAHLIKDIIASGKADMVAIGRGFFADSELAEKLRTDNYDDIRYCVACNQGCCDHIFVGDAATCMLNARASFEQERQLLPSDTPRNIAIIGAGPAGLEAARVAAIRGHKVTLYEQEESGGKLSLLAAPPEKESFLLFRDYLKRQVEKLGITIVKRRVENILDIQDSQAEAVIISTGSRQTMPPIPGHDLPIVSFAEDILARRKSVSHKAVIIGGGLVGVETAHFLADQGVRVTILEALDHIAKEAGATYRKHILDVISRYNIQTHTGVHVERILPDGLIFDGKKECADTVVIAAGYRSLNELVNPMKEHFAEVYVIGDARSPKNILQAVHDAYLCAAAI